MFVFLAAAALCLARTGAVVLPDFIDVNNNTLVVAFANATNDPSLAAALRIEYSLDFVGSTTIIDLNQDNASDVCMREQRRNSGGASATRILCALSPHKKALVLISNATNDLWRLASETHSIFLRSVSRSPSSQDGAIQADLDGDGFLDTIFFGLLYEPGAPDGSLRRAHNMFVVFGNSSSSSDSYFLQAHSARPLPRNVGFEIRTRLFADENTRDFIVLDFDGDGIDDIVLRAAADDTFVVGFNDAYLQPTHTVLLRGSRNRTAFAPVEHCGFGTTRPTLPLWNATSFNFRDALGGRPTIARCDVNGDGRLDTFFSRERLFVYGGTNLTLLSPADLGTAPNGFTITLPQFFGFIKCIDMNGDGLMDMLFQQTNQSSTAQSTSELYVLYGRAGRSRPSFSFNTHLGDAGAASNFDGFSIRGATEAISFSDFNGDEITDVVWGSTIVLGEKGIRTLPVFLANTTDPRVKQLDSVVRICSPHVDFDGDGRLDLLLSYNTGGLSLSPRWTNVTVVYNHTSGSLWNSVAPLHVAALAFPHTNITALGCTSTPQIDLNKDGASDLMLSSLHGPILVFGSARARQTPRIHVNTNGMDRSGSPPSAWPAMNFPFPAGEDTIADFNGDEFLDLHIGSLVLMANSRWEAPAFVAPTTTAPATTTTATTTTAATTAASTTATTTTTTTTTTAPTTTAPTTTTALTESSTAGSPTTTADIVLSVNSSTRILLAASLALAALMLTSS
jgi:hypothetical protein